MSKLIKLTEAEIDLVMQADDYLGSYSYSSTSQRWYTIARNRGAAKNNDIMVILCGVKNIANRAVCRPIGVTSVDAESAHYSSEADIIVSSCSCGARVKIYFDEDHPCLKSEYKGKVVWWSEKVKENSREWVWKRPLNINSVIAENPRFRYCALPKWGTPTMGWLRKYSLCPEIENFAKMHIEYLATESFVAQLKRDRDYFRYVRNNLDEIRRIGLSCTKIRFGYTHKMSPSDVVAKFKFDGEVSKTRNSVGRCYYGSGDVKFPSNFDWKELTRYLAKTKVSSWEYHRYAKYCFDGGADLTDPNTAFPRNLERRLKEFDENKRKMEIQECNRKLSVLSAKYKTMLKGVRSGKFIAVVPSASKSFVREGKRMGNCIGGGNYALNMAAETCVCVFIRKADKPSIPFVDCEISNGVVRQCYGRRNKRADKDVRLFADRIARRLFKNNKKTRKAA